jgi:hypothetical protein
MFDVHALGPCQLLQFLQICLVFEELKLDIEDEVDVICVCFSLFQLIEICLSCSRLLLWLSRVLDLHGRIIDREACSSPVHRE